MISGDKQFKFIVPDYQFGVDVLIKEVFHIVLNKKTAEIISR